MKGTPSFAVRIGLVLLAAVATATAPLPADGTARRTQDRLLDQISQYYRAADAEGMASLWAEDGVLIFEGDEIAGAEAIREGYAQQFAGVEKGRLELRFAPRGPSPGASTRCWWTARSPTRAGSSCAASIAGGPGESRASGCRGPSSSLGCSFGSPRSLPNRSLSAPFPDLGPRVDSELRRPAKGLRAAEAVRTFAARFPLLAPCRIGHLQYRPRHRASCRFGDPPAGQRSSGRRGRPDVCRPAPLSPLPAESDTCSTVPSLGPRVDSEIRRPASGLRAAETVRTLAVRFPLPAPC